MAIHLSGLEGLSGLCGLVHAPAGPAAASLPTGTPRLAGRSRSRVRAPTTTRHARAAFGIACTPPGCAFAPQCSAAAVLLLAPCCAAKLTGTRCSSPLRHLHDAGSPEAHRQAAWRLQLLDIAGHVVVRDHHRLHVAAAAAMGQPGVPGTAAALPAPSCWACGLQHATALAPTSAPAS